MESKPSRPNNKKIHQLITAIPRSQHIQNKVFLIWVKQNSASYTRVSTNVLREICGFITFRALLALNKRECISLYDLSAIPLKLLRLQKPRGAFNANGTESIACIGELQFLLSGGLHECQGLRTVAKAAFFLSDGDFRKVENMHISRCFHELYFDESTQSVFCFGGIESIEEATSTAERFSLNSLTWSRLPNMCQKGSQYVVCGCNGKVYIHTWILTHCEVFIIESERFHLLLLQETIAFYTCALLVFNEQLFFLGVDQLHQWDLGTKALIKKTRIDTGLTGPVLGVGAKDCFFLIDAEATVCICIPVATPNLFHRVLIENHS